MSQIQDQLPSLTYDLIFNDEFKTFEIWQYNNDFDTKALIQSYSLELITQLLKENFVNALLLLGGTMKQVPETNDCGCGSVACNTKVPDAPDDIIPSKKSV